MIENTTFDRVYNAEELTYSKDIEALETKVGKQTDYDLDAKATLGQAAGIMGKGMLGIFVVIGIIILCVYGLNKGGNRKKKEDKE